MSCSGVHRVLDVSAESAPPLLLCSGLRPDLSSLWTWSLLVSSLSCPAVRGERLCLCVGYAGLED